MSDNIKITVEDIGDEKEHKIIDIDISDELANDLMHGNGIAIEFDENKDLTNIKGLSLDNYETAFDMGYYFPEYRNKQEKEFNYGRLLMAIGVMIIITSLLIMVVF